MRQKERDTEIILPAFSSIFSRLEIHFTKPIMWLMCYILNVAFIYLWHIVDSAEWHIHNQ